MGQQGAQHTCRRLRALSREASGVEHATGVTRIQAGPALTRKVRHETVPVNHGSQVIPCVEEVREMRDREERADLELTYAVGVVFCCRIR